MEEGTPIPEASAAAVTAAAVARNAHQSNNHHQHHGTGGHGRHQHPPSHRRNHRHQDGHQMHGSRRYEGHGHGAVATHITIGGGGGSSTRSSTAHSSSQSRQPQQTKHNYHGSTDSTTSIQATFTSTDHRASSLSAAAGPAATAGARSKHSRNNRPTTQLHTHLVIGGGSSSTGDGDYQGRQNANNHHAGIIHTGNRQRLVIGEFTGHVSAGMPLPHDNNMNAGNNVGVGRQDFLSQHAINAGAAIPALPASGQSNLAPDEYDYDLLGGGVPDHVTERMEVEDIIPLPPLIVIDGANVAYAYGKAKSVGNNAIVSSHSASDHGGNASTYSRQGSSFGRSFQPDANGILIACNYFMNAGCRVQVVLPAQWLQTKSQRRNDVGCGSYHSTDESPALASEITPQLEVLHGLREQGLLCAAPSNDDDDSYAIMLARREDARAARRRGGGQAGQSKSCDGKPKSIVEEGGGFVLSNDQFRDAQSRDRTSSAPTGLGEWLEGKKEKKGVSRLQDRINNIPGRISYSFGDVGSINQYGDKELDLIPNPRHPLVEEIEQGNRARELSLA